MPDLRDLHRRSLIAWRTMALSTRMSVAMCALVVSTAASIALLSTRAFGSRVLDDALDGLVADARLILTTLQVSVAGVGGDVQALGSIGPTRALASADTEPDGVGDQLAEVFLAELSSKPDYLQLRYLDRRGHETVRVDRSGPDGAIRVVPAPELQDKSGRAYVTEALAAPAGSLYVSPVELNQEFGVVQVPHVPVLRLATPVAGPSGRVAGMVVVNVDLRRIFGRLRFGASEGRNLYLVSAGQYLVHPDPEHEFGGSPADSDGLDEALAQLALETPPGGARTGLVDSDAGRVGVGVVSTDLGGGDPVAVLLSEPKSDLRASGRDVLSSALIGGIALALIAALLGVVMARSFSRPVIQLAGAVGRFEITGRWSPPRSAGEEVETLSRALDALIRSERTKQDELEREIAVRRATEAALEREAERFRLSVEACPNGMLMVDGEGRIAMVNREVERLFGYERSEILGHSIEVLVPESARTAHPDLRQGFARDPRKRAMGSGRDLFGRHKDGSEIPVEIGLNPIRTPDGVLVLASVVDISERRAAEEELRRSNAELEQFAYVASHDLQEPLRMVATYTKLLGQRYQGQLDERADRYIHYAVDGAKRMQVLIRDLLRLSRLDSEATPPTSVDLSDLVHRIVTTDLALAIRESGGTVEVGELPVVLTDAVQISQVIHNLISNAVKFRAPDRPPVVRIDAERRGRLWRISVADNGIGIDEEHKGRVFEMFQRLHRMGEYPGSGIGLTLVRKIIQRQGGTVWLESIPGEGTTFHFTLPVHA